MKDPWRERWDDRYSKKEYAFGVEPNRFLKETLEQLNTGRILFPADGEGRNGVFAAKLGWDVASFDISAEGRKKALKLAEANRVTLDYQVGELPKLNYHRDQFDAIALIYAHFPVEIRSGYHKLLSTYLRKGGIVILEAFGKNHLEYKRKNPEVGGPSDLENLFSLEELKSDFKGFDIIKAEEREIELDEGRYHNGKGYVVRFVARKT